MNKTRIIKETIGNVLSKFGFKYAGKDQKIVWIFERIIEGVKEQVFIQQHTAFDEEYKIMLRSSARGNGMKEIGTIDDSYKDKEYWKAETEDEFAELMKFFADFIEEKCLDVLEDMLNEKPDPFETPERKQWFKEHFKTPRTRHHLFLPSGPGHADGPLLKRYPRGQPCTY